MHPKLQKTITDIERARAKISELQGLLPEMEKQKTLLEDAEIVKIIRSAKIELRDLAAFIESYQADFKRKMAAQLRTSGEYKAGGEQRGALSSASIPAGTAGNTGTAETAGTDETADNNKREEPLNENK